MIIYDRTTHSRRQCPRRHRLSHEYHKTNRDTERNHWRPRVHPGRSQADNRRFQSQESTRARWNYKWNYKTYFKSIPKTVTCIFNKYLKRGCFPKNWKIAKIILITKPGKEYSLDPSKYRPIGLLNIGGKVLEKNTYKQSHVSHIRGLEL